MPSFNSKSYQDAFWSELTVNPERSSINKPQGNFLDSPDQAAPGSMPEKDGHFRQPFDLGTPPKHRARAPFSMSSGKDTQGRWPFTQFNGWTGFGNIQLPENEIPTPPPGAIDSVTFTSSSDIFAGSGLSDSVAYGSTEVQSTPSDSETPTSSDDDSSSDGSSTGPVIDPNDSNYGGCTPAGCCSGFNGVAPAGIGDTVTSVLRGGGDNEGALNFKKCVREGQRQGCSTFNDDLSSDEQPTTANYVVDSITAEVQMYGCPETRDAEYNVNGVGYSAIEHPGGINVTFDFDGSDPNQIGRPRISGTFNDCCGDNPDINDCAVINMEWKVRFVDANGNCSPFTCNYTTTSVDCCCEEADVDEGTVYDGNDSPVFPPQP